MKKVLIIAIISSLISGCSILKGILGQSASSGGIHATAQVAKDANQNNGTIAASGKLTQTAHTNAKEANKSAIGAKSQAVNAVGVDDIINNPPVWELGIVLIGGIIVGWFLRNWSANREKRNAYRNKKTQQISG